MARYDRVIPPGGRGKITLEIDTTRIRGDYEKKAVVWSNDPSRMSVALYLRGHVKPIISLEPGNYISLWRGKDQVPREQIEIINNNKDPLKIIKIETDIPKRIRWQLEEIEPGYIYRLEVENISEGENDYNGHLIIHTDNPQKPVLVIVINSMISE